METFSALLAICAGNSLVTGEFPAQRPVMRSFDVFFDLCPNQWLTKQLWGWWFEMTSRPLWCHCNASLVYWQWRYKYHNFPRKCSNNAQYYFRLSSARPLKERAASLWQHITTIMASQLAGQLNASSAVCSDYNKRTSKVHIAVSLRGIHWRPVVSLHKGTEMWKVFPFFDVIMLKNMKRLSSLQCISRYLCTWLAFSSG